MRKPNEPFNAAAHDHLLSSGYAYERMFDDGDPENGPGTSSSACDVYNSIDETVGISEMGIADHQVVDPIAREFCRGLGDEDAEALVREP